MTTLLIGLRCIGFGFSIVGCQVSLRGERPLPRDTWAGEERSKAQEALNLVNRRAIQWTSIGVVLAVAAELIAAMV